MYLHEKPLNIDLVVLLLYHHLITYLSNQHTEYRPRSSFSYTHFNI
jgi:hypothetical protein